MALGLDLKLRMGLQLVMTPQLQLAIRLLQMSSLELAEYLQEELEKNPLLDEDDGEEEVSPANEHKDEGKTYEDEDDEGLFPPVSREEAVLDPSPDAAHLEDDLALDTSWSDVYTDAVGGSYEGPSDGEAPPLENTLTRDDSLIDHLVWQMNLSARNERERSLGLLVIDDIDENGYVSSELTTLAKLGQATLDEIEDVLVLVQSFDPPGVGARNLAECLRLQLKAKGLARAPCAKLLDHLDDLARRDFRKLGRLLKLDEAELGEAVRIIQSLNPKPGLLFGSEETVYVVPDVFIRKQGNQWLAEINPDTTPRLRVNRYYQDAAGGRVSANDRRFLMENARSAHWLIKSLEQRTRTILRVAESIIQVQRDFLEKGAEYLKPLTLKDIADDVGVHESTISRVTSNKYAHTPRGVFEFKYFFSSSLSSPTGAETHSAEAVKFKLRKMMEGESTRHPYSDEKLAQMLQEQGIEVARRTVAKYREALGIPPSSRRKKLEGG